jgi:hypothetical protein
MATLLSWEYIISDDVTTVFTGKSLLSVRRSMMKLN